jgi:hypothetical protein
MSTILRRMAQRDQRIARETRPRPRRYCPMCEVWYPSRITICPPCGLATEPEPEPRPAPLPKPERVE